MGVGWGPEVGAPAASWVLGEPRWMTQSCPEHGSLFLIVELEADAASFAPGQRGGWRPWAFALRLAGAPGAQQLTLFP